MPVTAGCACPHCHGLAEWMERHGLNAPAGLPRATGHTAQALTIVTQGSRVTTTTIECDGSMLCGCPDCDHQRALLVQHGPRRVRQPWEAAA